MTAPAGKRQVSLQPALYLAAALQVNTEVKHHAAVSCLGAGFFGKARKAAERHKAFESFAAGGKLVGLNAAGEL
ncbi:hypothetical protein GCM10022228_14570 [Halomonas cibimaris]|uniref:Uncharacterized protein n=1 Tax=Halomonas cibimaris TaxID=657012 RepID=A0ABP7LRA3_9GAMM